MRIIVSPAKRMQEDADSMPVLGRPMFLSKTRRLYEYLRDLSCQELQTLLGCNDKIAFQNYQRYRVWELLPQRHRRCLPIREFNTGI